MDDSQKQFRTAIVGCGGIFSVHGPSLAAMENVKITAVCDIKPERAEEKAAQYGCAAYSDFERMLDCENPDVLHICTPHYLHAPMTVAVLERGIHVLTEKPMATTLDDAERMLRAAKASGKTLGVIFQNRYNQASRLMKETLASGALGNIRGGKLSVTWHRDESYYTESGWRGAWATEGGGVVINQSIHTFDLMNWLVGRPFAKVEAHFANRAHPVIEVEDAAEGRIIYDNGVSCSFFVTTYHSHDAPVELELDCDKGNIRLVGEKAAIAFDDGRTFTAERDPRENVVYGVAKDYWGVSHIKQIRNFYGALAAGAVPDITGEAAMETQRLIMEIYRVGRANFER